MDKIPSNTMPHLVAFFEQSVDKYPDAIAIICDDMRWSYQALDERANQLAHVLLSKGIRKQSIVGLLLERSADCYMTILAILKIGATYVPIETEYPEERINHILSDMPFDLLVTSSKQLARAAIHFPKTFVLDHHRALCAKQSKSRLSPLNDMDEHSCYIIYTSGSTGKPKGVEVPHQSICHYVTVASELYQICSTDVIYQGFSLAFDASLEEVWMAFANGATLAVATNHEIRFGLGLSAFLIQHKVSVFSTVPTLLAFIEEEIPSLRLLILGGEVCTVNMIKHWVKPGLQIINTYGPTETSVVATYHFHSPENAMSIGKPLPGYEVKILDETLAPVSSGEAGELFIGGKALAKGYVNRPDITHVKFIQDPSDPTQRLYRTGDLAEWTASGEIQLLGRMDDQVKLRGFRIELNEIEAVMMRYPGITQAIVALQTIDAPMLVAYLLPEKNQRITVSDLKAFLLQQLPSFMMPSAFMVVDAFPTLANGKVNRKALPPLSITIDPEDYRAPNTQLEKEITEVWQSVLQRKAISTTADFFYDLGGHSLSAARVVSKLRQLAPCKNVSLLELYQHKTIAALAAVYERSAEKEEASCNKAHEPSAPSSRNPVSPLKYYWCGVGQFFGCLFQYALSAWQLLAVILCYVWISKQGALFSVQSVAIFSSLLIIMPMISAIIVLIAKWVLLGRVKPGQYPLWGWFYFRWWFVLQLQHHLSPSPHLMGSPLFNVYNRLLGAKIGKNCFIGSEDMVGHDLITIGDETSIGYETDLKAYIVEDGWLKLGPISIGDDCFVGARCSFDLYTVMENGAFLDDLSMLRRHARIPEGQYYSGSPAKPLNAPPEKIHPNRSTPVHGSKKATLVYCMLHYVALFAVFCLHYGSYLPSVYLLDYVYSKTHAFSSIVLMAPVAALLFFLVYFSMVILLKKVIMNNMQPGRYPLRSWHYLRQWTVLKMLHVNELLVMADSLYYPFIMKRLGAKIGRRVEMGQATHVIPEFIHIREEGFLASFAALAWPCIYHGVSEFASIDIDHRSFAGNVSYISPGAHIGAGGLVGCMTIAPSNSQSTKKNMAWLGSPPFYLPNRETFVGFSDEQTFHPKQSMVLMRLTIELIRILMPTATILIGLLAIMLSVESLMSLYSIKIIIAWLPWIECGIALSMVSSVVSVKWLIEGKLKPSIKPLWDLFIFKNDMVEYWYSHIITPFFARFVLGTPFMSLMLRALGSKVGKYACIDSDVFAEFDLIQIGDEVSINSKARIQTHLYEDRIFKISQITIHAKCNVGHNSIILYNTEMGEQSSLGNLSLLMKGETLPPNTAWSGCPAQYIPDETVVASPTDTPS